MIEVIDLEQGTLISRNKLNNFNNLRKDIYQMLEDYFFIKTNLLSIKNNENIDLDNSLYLKIKKETMITLEDEFIVTLSKDNDLNFWDTNTLTKIDSMKINQDEMFLFFENDTLVTQKDNELFIYNTRNKNKVFSFSDNSILENIKIFYVNNEKIIVFKTQNDESIILNIHDKHIEEHISGYYCELLENRYYTVNTREINKKTNVISNYYNIYDIKDKKFIYKEKLENNYKYLRAKYNKLLINDSDKLIIKNIKTGHIEREFEKYNIISLPDNNDNKLILKNEDGDIEIFDINTLKLLAKYYVFKSATFIITTEGYFYGEGDYKNYFYFKSENEEYISLDKVNEFNRPDIVQKVLNGENVSSYKTLEYSM